MKLISAKNKDPEFSESSGVHANTDEAGKGSFKTSRIYEYKFVADCPRCADTKRDDLTQSDYGTQSNVLYV